MASSLVFGDRLIGRLSLNKEEKGFYGEVHVERAEGGGALFGFTVPEAGESAP